MQHNNREIFNVLCVSLISLLEQTLQISACEFFCNSKFFISRNLWSLWRIVLRLTFSCTFISVCAEFPDHVEGTSIFQPNPLVTPLKEGWTFRKKNGVLLNFAHIKMFLSTFLIFFYFQKKRDVDAFFKMHILMYSLNLFYIS